MGTDDFEIQTNVTLFVILGIFSCLIVSNNIFVIIVISSSKKLHTVTGYLMISLAFADLGVGITTQIPLIYPIFSTHIPRPACTAVGFLTSVSMVVSVYTLTLLSLDRFVAIVKPLHYPTIVTNHRCSIAILVSWVASVIMWVFPLGGFGSYKFNPEEAVCEFNIEGDPEQ